MLHKLKDKEVRKRKQDEINQGSPKLNGSHLHINTTNLQSIPDTPSPAVGSFTPTQATPSSISTTTSFPSTPTKIEPSQQSQSSEPLSPPTKKTKFNASEVVCRLILINY